MRKYFHSKTVTWLCVVVMLFVLPLGVSVLLQAETVTVRRITQAFYVYSEPSLYSEKLFDESFPPEDIIVLDQLNGWTSIRTLRGEGWTHIYDNPPGRFYSQDAHLLMHIPWVFYVYTEPDFKSDRVGSFGFTPQYVRILQRDGNWALIPTFLGDGWIYTAGSRMFTGRTMGIFDQIDGTMVSHITPQVVSILDRYNDWLKIDTWLGDKWIDLNFTPPTYELDRLLRRFGNNLSVYFENLETGFVYTYNANRVYFSASVPKASFALYIYLLAEQGYTDLDNLITFTNADFMGGSGRIRHRYSVGATFTQREVLRLNLSYSDNIATNMLRRIHGTSGYRQFVADIGGNPNLVGNGIMNSNLTANEAGLFAREIFNYIESDGRYSEEFRAHLLDNQYPFIVSDYPVASKTGWTRPIAWHDMAIVYAPSPYILVILSARNGWSAQDYRDFEEISMAFQRFNDMWFVN